MKTRPSLEQLKLHISQLESARSVAERIHIWRLIAHCALDAHELECRELDALKVPIADPAFDAPVT